MRIADYMQSLVIDMRVLLFNMFDLMYYGRGMISYTEMMYMSVPERQILADVLNERVKQSRESPFPFW